ncbi:flagellar hook-associated protein FlgK [Nocardioides sp. InS609-2]|uniref:flagellar hook-associated protein FlgK n=1 Tax=Nocardioides sp. InS609-2 TaxID=2760705 RepID=UPI0020C0EBB5|nr:flagellar hook-associated protein FlgK [Nocardioides sp. InS609-2]
MSGSFSSFNTGLSALRYNQVAMDVASGNIANSATEGYARRRVEAGSVGAPPQLSMWSRYSASGDGVSVMDINRLVDPLLDARARTEHSNQSYLNLTGAVLDRIEAGIGEPGDSGVSAALTQFGSGWHDLANHPGEDSARNQVLARAGVVVDALRNQAGNITEEASDQRFRLQITVEEVNVVASDLASINESIATAKLTGSDGNVLLDQRDALALRLSELTGATAKIRSDGGVDVTVGGVALVTGQQASRLEIASGVAADGSADGAPVTFRISDGLTTIPVTGAVRGEAGGVTELLNVTLPGYLAALDAVAKTFADEINAQHAAGYDAAGNPGQPLFSYNSANAAASLTLAVTNPGALAASGLPGGVLDGSNADKLSEATSAEKAYQSLVSGFGARVASVHRLAANQQVLTAQVDGSREQLSGVNLDEEMVNMLSAQRAYEAASRVISTVDSVLDTLINRTGLVGR